MGKYQETLEVVKAARNEFQLEQAEQIQARVKRYKQQEANFKAVEDGRVADMLRIFKPRLSILNDN
jgi:hypothetical protein